MSNNQQQSSTSAKMKNEQPPIDDLQQTFIRKAQFIEQQKFNKARAIRMRNRLSGLVMATVVGSIYFYTIMTVKQEKFLDELDDEPNTK
ncbi:Cytochrome c oxidase assembly factor 3, mitochondrial [Dermatophagoides pteronyssinus]|uniref:Cytochrome c oxidase assembly factor 3, mitochondrial n=2 Tax=Dermatophagoides pteronyssinus TaxID=6956 RepID=A0ABQ8JLH3_DERPT|nr:cytochrome c oxidase assembly factor 3 homolog, mitochondrial-like [Dermatophagoides pteronyssinus]KAH9423448.1 Cytochrome c oxidase assembly factor 3, mitochondrial [Dermatophagoides pteronyssinus]